MLNQTEQGTFSSARLRKLTYAIPLIPFRSLTNGNFLHLHATGQPSSWSLVTLYPLNGIEFFVWLSKDSR
jgi:hypothetical protein